MSTPPNSSLELSSRRMVARRPQAVIISGSRRAALPVAVGGRLAAQRKNVSRTRGGSPRRLRGKSLAETALAARVAGASSCKFSSR